MNAPSPSPTGKERRSRTVTDADIQAIIDGMKKSDADHCVFDEETRSLLKLLSKVYGDARTAAVKGIVALLIIGGLVVVAFGAGVIKPE